MIRPELLSDKEVLQETKGLVGRECRTTLTILVLLGEIEERKLHVKLGYSSLFTYCTQHLRYSTSAAGRRVQVARCMRRFSVARQLFASGEVNLSTLGILAPVLNEKNAPGLLERIRNKSQRAVYKIVCGERPAVMLRDRATPVRVIVPAKPAQPNGGSSSAHDGDSFSRTGDDSSSSCGDDSSSRVGDDTRPSSGSSPQSSGRDQSLWNPGSLSEPGQPSASETSSSTTATETTPKSRSGSVKTPNSGLTHSDPARISITAHRTSRPDGRSRPAVEIQEKTHVQFTASSEFMKKFYRAQALLAHRCDGFEQVFERALDLLLDKHDPKQRNARRAKRLAGKLTTAAPAEDSTGKAPQAKRRGNKPPPTPANTGNAFQGKQCEEKLKPTPAQTGNTHQTKQRTEARSPHTAHTDDADRARHGKEKSAPTSNPRYIPAGVRDRIFERDGGRCTYVGPSGRRCTARHYLQIDHVRPVARGGTRDIANLRLLCGAHNRMEAERVLGRSCATPHRAGASDQDATSGAL